MSYIIEQDSSERESVATHRLLATMPLRAQLFHGVSWFIMELRFSTLGLDEAGEIDIIGGRLTFSDLGAYRSVYTEEAAQWPEAAPGFLEMMATRRFVQDGGLAWPPPMDLLVGVEVKCSYENEGVIKSAKNSRDKLWDLRIPAMQGTYDALHQAPNGRGPQWPLLTKEYRARHRSPLRSRADESDTTILEH